MIDIQLQIVLIAGIGGGLIALLLLSTGILIYYMTKLNGEIRDLRRMISKPSPIPAFYTNTGFNSSIMNLDNELNRRYRQFSPAGTLERPTTTGGNHDTLKSQSQSYKSVTRNSVIPASEEFRWEQNNTLTKFDKVSNYHYEEHHEGREKF